MKHKLLVITAGTIATGVGKEFLKQIASHPHSELQAMVRYIDTAYLPTRYSGLRDGEWLQMTIDPRFIDSIRRNKDDYPHLRKLFYPGLYPQIQGSGCGSIRYYAAGAVAIGRDRLKQWLHTSITDLIRSGGGDVHLSIALIISAVGATGSGAYEQLVDLIVDAANDASIPSPIHIDTYILQPGMQGVTDLGLANTLALYAEMAASRLSKTNTSNKSHRGRTLMVGWGSERYLASIDQLLEAAASLVRLTHDPSTDIAAEFQEREVDNHVLREQDTRTGLPSHLSSATVVTISLGDLEEKIIRRDAELLVDSLVLGSTANGSSTGDYIVPCTTSSDQQAGTLLDALVSFLEGSTPEARYQHLLSRLTEIIDLHGLQLTSSQMKDLSAQQQANQLKSIWQFDKEEIAKLNRQRIQEQGAALTASALNDIKRTQRERMSTGLSLQALREEYQQMQNMLTSTLKVAQEAARNAKGEQHLSQVAIDSDEVTRKLRALEKAMLFFRRSALEKAIGAVQSDLQTRLRREAYTVGIEVLKEIVRHCAETLRNLDAVIPKVRKLHNMHRGEAAEQRLSIQMNHPLHLAALSTHEEIMKYADQVSIFPSRSEDQGGFISRLITGEDLEGDPLAAFRKWLQDQKKLDILFEGKVEPLLEVASDYARHHFLSQMQEKEISVVNVLLQAGEGILVQRLREAAGKAHSLVSFSTQFAGERREARHVSAYYSMDQVGRIQAAIDEAFGEGLCTLIPSRDPTEIAILSYVDGLAMSAVTDLTGRCLTAFLRRRRSWYLQAEREAKTQAETSSNDNAPETSGDNYNQRVGVPVYSSKDAQERVLQTKVVQLLYRVRGQNVDEYALTDIPELDQVMSAQAGQTNHDGRTKYADQTVSLDSVHLTDSNGQMNQPSQQATPGNQAGN